MKNQPDQLSKNSKQRLLSIDALRGFDMIWILGAEGIFAALFTLTHYGVFDLAAQQMLHTPWHGFTAYDLIFPLFIFLSGVSLGLGAKPLSTYAPERAKSILLHGIKRLLLLIILGIVYNHAWGSGIPLAVDEIRYASVLGRIGIAWFVAALLVWYVSEKAQWLVAIFLLLAYWLLLNCITIGGYGGGDFSANGALNVWFDQTLLPGITYQNLAIDPEGLLSNVASIVNALIGVFIGRHMQNQQAKPTLLFKQLIMFGGILLSVGYLWGQYFPINKTLWTSSFVLVTTGYSALLLAVFYYLIDVLKFVSLAKFFAVIGTNSIIVYLGTSLVDWNYGVQSIFGGVINAFPSSWQALVSVVALVFIQWLVLYWLYCRKIFIKV